MLLFSKHARLRMLEREVKENSVIEAIENPDNLIIEGIQHTAVKRFGKNILLVVYNKSDSIDFVITVIFSSKLGKYLNK